MHCQIEKAFDRQSILCGDRAVVMINRRERGCLFVCKAHLTKELYAEVKMMRFIWYAVDGTGNMNPLAMGIFPDISSEMSDIP